MENQEYIIINKTALEKRIEELENKIDPNDKKSNPIWWQHRGQLIEKEINTLNEVLSQSTPLIPVVKKAWDASLAFNHPAGFDSGINKQDYIANLKLDI